MSAPTTGEGSSAGAGAGSRRVGSAALVRAAGASAAGGPGGEVRTPPAARAEGEGFGRAARRYFAVITPGSIRCGVEHVRSAVSQYDGGVSGESVRGRIEGFSADSRVRLLQRAVSLPWSDAVGAGGIGMVTFTYPAVFPTDGRVVKAQWDRLYARWVRHYGVPEGMWKMEFQGRGAPHFHVFVGLPEAEDELRAWLLTAWYESVGSGDERHLYNGVDISRWRWGTLGQNAGKIGEYFARHGAKGWKSYQNQLPEGFTSPGRWWGVWGKSEGFVPVEEVYEFADRQRYFNFRRVTWTLQEKNRGRAVRKGGRDRGAWSVSADGLTNGRRLLVGDGREPQGGESGNGVRPRRAR